MFLIMKKYCFYGVILFLSLGRLEGLALIETWESATAGDFGGTGDVTWTGDTSDFRIASAKWPRGPDFEGSRSLRSGGSSAAGGTIATVVTDISSAFDSSAAFRWSVFLSGNSADITTSKRVDLVLLADTHEVDVIESPLKRMNGYKLSLGDPLSAGGLGHAGASLGDSLSLWRVTSDQDEWQLVAAHAFDESDFPSGVNINAGWNIEVTRSPEGQWRIAFSNGALGMLPMNTVLTLTDNTLPLSGTEWYSGLGLLANSGDLNDFGFDQFTAISESPTTAFIIGMPLQALRPCRSVRDERVTL